MEIYIVRPGDTVDAIADAYHVSAQSIIYNNQLPYPYPLAVGQALLLPAGSPSPNGNPMAITGGYAYPFISRVMNTLFALGTLRIYQKHPAVAKTEGQRGSLRLWGRSASA